LEIAIVGLGCRFPEARDPLGYWELESAPARSPFGLSRLRVGIQLAFLRFDDPCSGKAYIDKGASLDDQELHEFASLHYGIAPRRIPVTDTAVPAADSTASAQRCRTRGTNEARVGAHPGRRVRRHQRLRDKEVLLSRVRVVQLFGRAFGRALQEQMPRRCATHWSSTWCRCARSPCPAACLNMAAGSGPDLGPLGGPALAIDGGMARRARRHPPGHRQPARSQIDLAIAEAFYLNLLPDNLVCFSRIAQLPPRRVRPFDAQADGFVMGEGAGRRDPQAPRRCAGRRRPHLYAVVRGAAATTTARAMAR